MKKLKLLSLIKLLCYLLCFIFFLFLMYDVWTKFTSGITTTGFSEHPFESTNKPLPCLTVCTLQGFKSIGFDFTESDYIRNTFDKSDLFVQQDVSNNFFCLNNITELRTPYLGRCYTVRFLSHSESNICGLVFNKGLDLIIFAHEEGKAHNVVTNNFKKEIEVLNIDFKEGIFILKVYLTEKKKTRSNKTNNKCRDYEKAEDYELCIKNTVWNLINKDTKCKLPGISEFIPTNVTLMSCLDSQIATDALKTFENATIYRNQIDCLPPCTSIFYPMTMMVAHKNSLNSQKQLMRRDVNNSLYMYFRYSTLQTTEEVETYIYDTVSFLAATGGNLGLLLGFSCLSVLLKILEKVSIMSTLGK